MRGAPREARGATVLLSTPMADTRDQTLTQVQSPLSPGEQRDRAVLLVSGNAVTPGLAARGRLHIVGDELYLGRRAEGLPVQASVAVLDDGLVSSQHARIVRGSGGYDLEDLGSKNGTFIDNLRAEGRQRLRDGALVFVGNHVGVFRMVSQIELEAIKAELVAPLGPVATASPSLAVACDRLRRLAASEGELFIVGETGVGKEVYARSVHEASKRKGKFVAINCAAIPRELVESELFGYRAGAHSTAHAGEGGADRGGRGRHAVPRRDRRDDARGADQDPALPAGSRADAAGSTRPRKMDVRVMAATNRTVVGPGKSGLRDDIVARLGAAPIHLPPLRNRIEDLGALIGHFLAGVPAQGPRFEQPAFRALTLHAWPLNVRELEKIVTTAAVLTGGKPIALRDLPSRSRACCRRRPRPARAVPPARRRRRPSSRSCCAATRATSPTCRASSASTAPPSGAGSRSSASARASSAAANDRGGRPLAGRAGNRAVRREGVSGTARPARRPAPDEVREPRRRALAVRRPAPLRAGAGGVCGLVRRGRVRPADRQGGGARSRAPARRRRQRVGEASAVAERRGRRRPRRQAWPRARDVARLAQPARPGGGVGDALRRSQARQDVESSIALRRASPAGRCSLRITFWGLPDDAMRAALRAAFVDTQLGATPPSAKSFRGGSDENV